MAKRNLPLGGATPMEPGERDRAVAIYQLVESRASSGMPKESWTVLVSRVWMRILDEKGTERFTGEQLAPKLETQFEMGYRSDMDPETVNVPKRRRLSYQGRIYDITSASMIGRREGIEMLTIARPTSIEEAPVTTSWVQGGWIQ